VVRIESANLPCSSLAPDTSPTNLLTCFAKAEREREIFKEKKTHISVCAAGLGGKATSARYDQFLGCESSCRAPVSPCGVVKKSEREWGRDRLCYQRSRVGRSVLAAFTLPRVLLPPQTLYFKALPRNFESSQSVASSLQVVAMIENYEGVQARSQVLRFWGGQNTFLGGQDFCFLLNVQIEFSWAQHNSGGNKNVWGALPRMPPRFGYGAVLQIAVSSREYALRLSAQFLSSCHFVRKRLWLPEIRHFRPVSYRCIAVSHPSPKHTFTSIHLLFAEKVSITLI